MHYLALFKGDYIAAVEFDGRSPTMTIKSVEVVGLEDDKGKTKDRGVVWFAETKRGWVLNRTNATLLAAMFGPETKSWAGKRVTLHAVEVQFGPKKVPGIRVKGSPDLERDLVAEVVLPRKKPIKVRLVRTGAAAKSDAPPHDDPPPSDDDAGFTPSDDTDADTDQPGDMP